MGEQWIEDLQLARRGIDDTGRQRDDDACPAGPVPCGAHTTLQTLGGWRGATHRVLPPVRTSLAQRLFFFFPPTHHPRRLPSPSCRPRLAYGVLKHGISAP
jgi:hypothetical protein